MIHHGLSDAVVAQIHAVLVQYATVQTTVLYGFRAMINFKNGSDIDLTLYGDGLTDMDLQSISSDLDDTSIPHTVDVSMFYQLTKEALKDHIRRVGVIFYERQNA